MPNETRLLIADASLAIQAQLSECLDTQMNIVSVLDSNELNFWLQDNSKPIDLIVISEEFVERVPNFFESFKYRFNSLNCQVIVLGEDCDAKEVKALRSGAAQYFRKPLNTEVITHRLSRLLEQRRAFLELEKQSSTDSLTGLFNRHYMQSFLTAEWGRAQREKLSMGMIVVDIDQFKLYNDEYGHVKGDDCLVRIANALSFSAKRPRDISVRFGGEEFVVILPNIQLEGMSVVARKIRESISHAGIRHANNAQRALVTVSMGLAWVQPHLGGTQEELFIAADKGLYSIKESGRDGYSKTINLNDSKLKIIAPV